MKRTTASKPASQANDQRSRKRGNSEATIQVRFSATILRPAASSLKAASGGSAGGQADGWTFLILPKAASAKLASRGMVSVAGTLNHFPFQATLQPDGEGGHWLKVDCKLREGAGAEAGDVVRLELAPVAPDQEPEPKVPTDLRKALAAASSKARQAWSDITPAARRDFIHWITSPKRPETRVKRIATACDMLANGKRRPCCFDRSGMYDQSMSCPVAADE